MKWANKKCKNFNIYKVLFLKKKTNTPTPTYKKTENQTFEKNKKTAGNNSILRMGTKNHNHLRSSSWDTEWDKQNFLSFRTIFWPFTPLTTQKIRILKKRKKTFRYYHYIIILTLYYYYITVLLFYTCVPKITIIWCILPEMQCDRDNCHFGPFFALLPH